MSTVNFHKREIYLKIVYYGPGLGGKTTSLEYIHRATNELRGTRGKLLSLSTDEDRTLFFDYLPLELPAIQGFAVRVQLYTVPGQVYYNSTRKLVLEGADGVVFVADSQANLLSGNVESLANLRHNLAEQGSTLHGLPMLAHEAEEPARALPWVIQYNKRDLPQALPIDELAEHLNEASVRAFGTVATTGEGIVDTLKAITAEVLAQARERARIGGGAPRESEVGLAAIPSNPFSPTGSEHAATPTQTSGIITSAVEPSIEIPGVTAAVHQATPSTSPRSNGATNGANQGVNGQGEGTTKEFPAQIKPAATLDDAFRNVDQLLASAEMAAAQDQPETETEPLPTDGPAAASPTADEAADAGKPAYRVADLVRSQRAKSAILAVEGLIAECDWAGAVRRAAQEVRELSNTVATPLIAASTSEPTALAIMMTTFPPSRLLRLRAAERRLQHGAAVSYGDAVFALFCAD